MVFQKPNPFLTVSSYDNVTAGLRLARRRSRAVLGEVVERSLRHANLWAKAKDRLHRPGASLSGCQQQRLCIARAIAGEPQVLLVDEPCSALGPISTLAIEDLISQLKKRYTIVIVTHHMQQATRVSDRTALFTMAANGQSGRLIELDDTTKIFRNPTGKKTEDYTGPLRLTTAAHQSSAEQTSTVIEKILSPEPEKVYTHTHLFIFL